MRDSPAGNIIWQEVRETVLSRDEYRCRGCNIKEHLHVHHLIPRHLGGIDEAENLIALCPACHAVHHPTLQVSLSKSFIERWAIRLAKFFDVSNEIPDNIQNINTVLRLLGKDCFREGQLEVVLAALRGDSILVIRPTGSGKTLCYQVPALITKGTAYIISPLKALMIDQSIGFHKNKIPSTFINSDLTIKEKEGRYLLLKKKALKFLFLTPERFDPDKIKNHNEIDRITQIAPNYLVIDEVHCVDRWGNDFRPSYGRLAEVRNQLGTPPILAFTATAGLGAQKRILSSLGIPDAKVFISDVDRPNIALIRHEPKSNIERYQTIGRCIAKNNGKAMIFVPTKKVGIEVQKGLSDIGLQIPFYHGQMNPVDREFLLGQFTGRIEPKVDNIICTNAFGMGLDIPNIHLVIHWMQPESVEDYLQEFGRAGRDGKPSTALIFKSKHDTGLRIFMAELTAKEAIKRGRDATDIQNTLATKIENINELDRMIMDRHRCFRKGVMDYFKEDKKIKRKSWAMIILEWLLCKQSDVKKTSFCCDFCDAKETIRWLKDNTGRVEKIDQEGRGWSRMKFKKKDGPRWKWRPKRWWIGALAFWLMSTVVRSLLGIDAYTNESDGFTRLIMFFFVLFAACTDRGWSVPKRIGWILLLWIFYGFAEIPFLFLLLSAVGSHPHIVSFEIFFRSLFFVIIAMRRSRFFVEPVNEIKIDRQQSDTGGLPPVVPDNPG